MSSHAHIDSKHLADMRFFHMCTVSKMDNQHVEHSCLCVFMWHGKIVHKFMIMLKLQIYLLIYMTNIQFLHPIFFSFSDFSIVQEFFEHWARWPVDLWLKIACSCLVQVSDKYWMYATLFRIVFEFCLFWVISKCE